jgi:hypothetical protein
MDNTLSSTRLEVDLAGFGASLQQAARLNLKPYIQEQERCRVTVDAWLMLIPLVFIKGRW